MLNDSRCIEKFGCALVAANSVFFFLLRMCATAKFDGVFVNRQKLELNGVGCMWGRGCCGGRL